MANDIGSAIAWHPQTPPAICHPERELWISRWAERRSFAALRMTAVLKGMPLGIAPAMVSRPIRLPVAFASRVNVSKNPHNSGMTL
jgi:hypothetical protein